MMASTWQTLTSDNATKHIPITMGSKPLPKKNSLLPQHATTLHAYDNMMRTENSTPTMD